MKVLQIVPRVPPAVCGIGDYSWLLARALRDGHDIHSSFLSAGTNRTQPEGETEFPVFRLPQLTTSALADFMATKIGEYDAVILHMSPYGYQKRGVPLWLAAAWQELSRMRDAPRLVTMFHELHASGSVNSSAFWLQPLQKHVLGIIARASDGLRTNREAYAGWLRGVSALKSPQVRVLPVFSNLGEPSVLPDWETRDDAMALFAWGIHSGESLDDVVRKAASWGRRFGMQRLHLIGGKQFQVPKDLELDVKLHGFMEVAEVSALLGSCRMAYTAYSPQHFGKSGLMAAFAAHGLAVITQGRLPSLPDGLIDGLNILNEHSLPDTFRCGSKSLAMIGMKLRSWYDNHSLAANTKSYAGQIHALELDERKGKIPLC